MARTSRQQSESGFYHVFARGSGRQLIYEDDEDRMRFLDIMLEAREDSGLELVAYCLMGNHYHEAVNADFGRLSEFVRKVNHDYALYFNKRHGRSGHLFQERFGSEPIEDDSYLLEAVRYIHRNPVEARISRTCDYTWSSYWEYLNEGSAETAIVRTDMVLDMLGGRAAFEEFHAHSGKASFVDDMPARVRMSDCEVLAVARSVLGGANPGNLKSLGKGERDSGLRALKECGLSLSQISLITGVSRATVGRA